MTQAEHMRIVMAIRGEASEAIDQFGYLKAAGDDTEAARWLEAWETLWDMSDDYYEQEVASRG